MNVTEKQKQILIHFMRRHPDFGRGRLRYNRENKRKMDELWEEVTADLNSAGSGPQKLPKEWAKTWRDWKSNLLKRVAAYRSYAAGTGGGQPKILDTSPSEEDLLDFLTPEASGMSGIPEGGAIGDSLSSQSLNFIPLTTKKSMATTTLPNKELLASQTLPAWKNSDVMNIDSDIINVDENLPINISSNVLAATENVQKQIPTIYGINLSPISTKSNKRFSDDTDISNKNTKKQNVKHLFEKHTSNYNDIQERMLELKKEKLTIHKEELELKKKAYEEHTELLTSLVDKVDELVNVVRSIAPQYLE